MTPIVLLFGGTSSENLVSVATAQNLQRFVPQAELWFWNEKDEILKVERADLIAHKNPFMTPFQPAKTTHLGTIETAWNHFPRNAVVLMGLHGGKGENGWIQKILEDRKISFTGTRSAASALAMDKDKTKKEVAKHGVNIAPSILLSTKATNFTGQLTDFLRQHKKIIAKPFNDGSSRGLEIIDSEAKMADALTRLQSGPERTYLVEKFVRGRELTIGVISLKNGELMVLPCSEAIVEQNAAFDYEGKYLGRGSKEITPAEITREESDRAQKVALTAHRVLGCRGCTRSEVIFNDEGVFFLETNTLPGLTAASFIPQQLQAAGKTMEWFLEVLIEDALS